MKGENVMVKTASDAAIMIILVAGTAITEISSDYIVAGGCECAQDEGCYSCNDCNDSPECAC